MVAAGAPVAGFLSLDLAGHGESAALPTRAGRWGDFVGSNIRSALRSAGLVDEGGDALPDLVGLGHSMGGTAVLLAQLEHAGSRPLFSRLALVEPVLFDHAAVVQRDSPKANRLYAATMMRQRTLKDREALMAYLTERRRPWASWDSRALEAYASSGFREAEGGGGALELVCKPETEAPLYLHPPAMIERLRDAASLGAPVTFLVGAESNHFDMVKGRAHARVLPPLRRAAVPAAGERGDCRRRGTLCTAAKAGENGGVGVPRVRLSRGGAALRPQRRRDAGAHVILEPSVTKTCAWTPRPRWWQTQPRQRPARCQPH